MGFFDTLKKIVEELPEKNMECWQRKYDQAERDYDRGRISFEEYSSIANKYIEVTGNYIDYKSKKR